MALDAYGQTVVQAASLCVLLLSTHAHGQACNANDFSVMYNGQAYLTVSAMNGTTTIVGPLLVGGFTSLAAGAAVSNGLAVNGATSITGPLTVSGPTLFAAVFATAGVTSTNGITLTGGYLRVESGVALFTTGATFSSVAPTFPAGIAGPVSFSGAVTGAGGVSVTGGSLQVSSGVATFSTGATFGSVAPTFPAGIGGPVSFSGAVTVAGRATLNGGVSIASGSVVDFGAGATGRDPDAGKMGYGIFSGGAGLDIVGAGLSGSRQVNMWDNLRVMGTVRADGLLTANGGVSVPSGSLSVAGTSTLGTMNANTCSCGTYTTVPKPTIYYSTRPAARYNPSSIPSGTWIYTNEVLQFTLTVPTRMRFHARHMVHMPGANFAFIISFSNSISAFNYIGGTPNAYHIGLAGLWTTTVSEWYHDLAAGSYTYAVWWHVYSGNSGAPSFACENGSAHCMFYAVAG